MRDEYPAVLHILGNEIAARGIRAIIFRHYPWCDIWNAELQRMRQWPDVPVLDLGIGGEGDDRCRKAGRIQALLESLT